MDGMSVRIQGMLVTSSCGMTKYLTRSRLKEQRSFWLMVWGTAVHHGCCMAGECGAWLYLSAKPGNQNQGAYNSSLQSLLDQLLPMWKGFPDSQDNGTKWQKVWRHVNFFPFSFVVATFPFFLFNLITSVLSVRCQYLQDSEAKSIWFFAFKCMLNSN